LFFDFAGYSDMAIGISEMFGYKCMENFNYPYMTESVSKFWRRWHISLSEWFRDYVYFPMGGSKTSKWKVYFNLFVVWFLTGIWHGAAWNFIAWGLGYFIVISLERFTGFPKKFKTVAGKTIYRFIALLFINFQWVLFNSASIIDGFRFIKRMIVYRANDLASSRALFLLKEYMLFIVVAVILCFPIVPWLEKKLSDNKILHGVFEITQLIVIILAFVWAISFVVAGQNNPFAYANF
jgi:alginate O-acetyltransferase complex protein AlgI